MFTIRKTIRTTAAALAITTLAPLASSSSVSAYGGDPDGVTTVATDTRMLNCPDTDHSGCKERAMGVPAGTKVRVRCVAHGEQIGATTLWAFVTTAGGNEGFVPAVRLAGDYTRYVSSGHPAPKCSDVHRVDAMMWAAHQLGQVTPNKDVRDLYSLGAFGDGDRWSGDCIKFAQAAYALTGGPTVPAGNAGPVGQSYGTLSKTKTDIPAGALVFWTGGAGHVAVSLGRGGWLIGTSGSDGSADAITSYRADESGWGTYLGWVVPGGG